MNADPATRREAVPRRIRVLLADRNPVCRHWVAHALGRDVRLHVMPWVGTDEPLEYWPLEGIDVALLTAHPLGDPSVVRALAARRIRTLVVGAGWTRQLLDEAFASGVLGCLTKDIDIAALGAAVRAVAAGHTVLSPELHDLHMTGPGTSAAAPPAGGGRDVGTLMRSLTDRELQVLHVLAEGASTAEAGARLKVAPATVKSHVSHILAKLGVRNRLEAVLLMRRWLDRGTWNRSVIARTSSPDSRARNVTAHVADR
nr:response regulator transcription factor [Streptomyces sp. NBC_01001]